MNDKKKKIIKVIQVIYDILSLGFILFVVCAMVIAPKSENHSNNNAGLVMETKTKDNIFTGYDDTYTISWTYLMSETFTTSLLHVLYESNPAQYYKLLYNVEPSDTTSATYTFYQGGIGWYAQEYQYPSGYLRPLNGTMGINEYTKLEVVFGYANQYYKSYTFKFYDRTDALALSYQMECQTINPDSNQNIFAGWSLAAYYGTPFSSIYLRYLTCYEGDYLWKACKSIIDNNYEDGYALGYDEGKEYGEMIGFENGKNAYYDIAHEEGYNEGFIAGSRGIESNAFVVIGQAFSAMSNIFSIEVLPSLPLWVLVFAPLIVAVVIVVVKLIKG